MKINLKRALSLIVLTIFAMSFVTLPVVSAEIGRPDIDEGYTDIEVGQTLTVIGSADSLTSGAEVKVYWDIADGPNAHYLASGYGENDGSYEVEIEVPVTTVGIHYVWVRDVATDDTNSSLPITIIPSIVATPDSGLKGDSILIEGYGFDPEEEVGIGFYNSTYTWSPVANLTSVDSDDTGYFSKSVSVPSDATFYSSDYHFNATSFSGTTADVEFTITASMDLSDTEGPAGTVVTIDARGYTPGEAIGSTNFSIMYYSGFTQSTHINIVSETTVGTGSNEGEFSVDLVIPSLPEGEYEITLNDGTVSGTANFTVDGETTVVADPTFGAPGTMITVTGDNYTQKAGTDVTITIAAMNPKTVEVDSNGHFEVSYSVPAPSFDTHDLLAVDDYDVNATFNFKVGILAVIIQPLSGLSGTALTISGVGFFAGGDYNVTFGDDLIETGGTVADPGETVYTTIYVPTVEPGEYQVAIVDENGATLGVPFTVTGSTTLTPTPSDVALGYNLTLSGTGFAMSGASDDDVECWVYNDTWDKEIILYEIDSTTQTVVTDEDGEFEGYWTVSDDLILGNTYSINATTYHENGEVQRQYAETSITIVEEEVEIGPTKSSYALGEIITFRIKATFKKADAVLEVKDPSGELYFKTVFADSDWTYVGGWWVVQVRNQIDDNSLFPYMIPEDATTGTWTWSLDYSEEKYYNGTIEVLPTTAAQINDRINNIEDSLVNVSAGLGDVTGQLGRLDDLELGLSDLASQVSDNSQTLDDLSTQVTNAVTQATSAVDAAQQAVSAAQAATSAAQNAATVAQEAVSAANSAKAEAQSAKNAANEAATAATEAANATGSLSTLVYVAIGASLIAALAAIISLMQINKRIAG